MIVARGDEAALAALGRGRGHQRQIELVDQFGVAAQRATGPHQQFGKVFAALQQIADPPRLGQSVAHLPQIARAAAACDHASQCATDIGRPAQQAAQIGAQQRIGVEMAHCRQPRVDRGACRERRGEILRQQPRARAGDAAIDRRQQAACAPARLRGQDLEARPRRRIHRQMRRGPARARRQQERHLAAAGVVEIGQQPARRRQHRAREFAQPVQCREPVQRLQPRLAFLAAEIAARAGNGIGDRTLWREVAILGHHRFARAQPRQRRLERVGGAFLQFHPSGRDIAGGDPDRIAQGGQRDQEIGAARIEQRVLGQRARGDEADDVARYQRLGAAALPGFFGRLDLFGDRHPAAAADQPREIAFRRMHRHAAHRHRLAVMRAAAGQRDVEDARRHLGILEKQFEEIAHPVEQQRLPRLLLERVVLLHHRGFAAGHAARVPSASRFGKRARPAFPLSLGRAAS